MDQSLNHAAQYLNITDLVTIQSFKNSLTNDTIKNLIKIVMFGFLFIFLTLEVDLMLKFLPSSKMRKSILLMSWL